MPIILVSFKAVADCMLQITEGSWCHGWGAMVKKALAASQRAEVLIRAMDSQLIQTLMSPKGLQDNKSSDGYTTAQPWSSAILLIRALAIDASYMQLGGNCGKGAYEIWTVEAGLAFSNGRFHLLKSQMHISKIWGLCSESPESC